MNENDVVSLKNFKKMALFQIMMFSAILTKQLGANLLVMITEKGGILMRVEK